MDKEKPTRVIAADFDRGERIGRSFNRAVTVVVPLVVLAVMIIGITSIFSQYSSTKQGFLSQLSVKQQIVENKEKEIGQLKSAAQVSANEIDTLKNKAIENETKYKKLLIEYKVLKKDYIKLKKRKPYVDVSWRQDKRTVRSNKRNNTIVSQILHKNP